MTPAVSLERIRRREELLDAADLVVQRDGASASMLTIAAEAGITKPVLYRHFGDKAGLHAALAERHTERMLGLLQATLLTGRTRRERVEHTIDAYLGQIEAEPEVYRFLMRSEGATGSSTQVRTFLDRLVEVLAAGIAAELRLPGQAVRAQTWARGIVGMVQSAGDWWLEDRPCPRAELTGELTELVWGGFRSDPRPVSRADARHADARHADALDQDALDQDAIDQDAIDQDTVA